MFTLHDVVVNHEEVEHHAGFLIFEHSLARILGVLHVPVLAKVHYAVRHIVAPGKGALIWTLGSGLLLLLDFSFLWN